MKLFCGCHLCTRNKSNDTELYMSGHGETERHTKKNDF